MIRLFIALEIPESIRKELYSQAVKANERAGFKLEKEDKIHLTLKFLGDVREGFESEITGRLKGLEEFSEITCTLVKFSFFYRDKKPSIFKADLKVERTLFEIVKFIENEMESLGFAREKREYKPHLTLARIKQGTAEETVNEINNYKLLSSDFKCSNIVLFKSTLTPSGSNYNEIKKFRLKPLEE